MIKNQEHLNTSNIVALDVEYGGGRTVPRIAVVNFNEECVYYTDFCFRHEDWAEMKLIESMEEQRKVEQREMQEFYTEKEKDEYDDLPSIIEDEEDDEQSYQIEENNKKQLKP